MSDIIYTTGVASFIIQIITTIVDTYALAIPTPPNLYDIKALLWVEYVVNLIEGIFYFWMISNFSVVKNITIYRYYDWVITTPTMLFTYSMYLLIVKEYNSNITPKDTLIKVFNQTNIKIKFINELLDNFTQEKKHVEELQNINPKKQVEDNNLEEENKLLREKLLQAEEKIKQLQEEILSLKSQKQSKSIKDYFGKK